MNIKMFICVNFINFAFCMVCSVFTLFMHNLSTTFEKNKKI